MKVNRIDVVSDLIAIRVHTISMVNKLGPHNICPALNVVFFVMFADVNWLTNKSTFFLAFCVS